MGTAMLSGSALGEDVVFAHRIDSSLRAAGPSTWPAGGEIRAMHVVPGGELAALVESTAGLQLVRWTAEGRELLRRPSPSTASTQPRRAARARSSS